jgi:chemotaxis protein histidine kinase CheA
MPMDELPSNQKWVQRFKRESVKHLEDLRLGITTIIPRQPLSGTIIEPDNLDKLGELNPELRELFRLAHSLKGSSGMVGLLEVSEIANNLEKELGQVFRNPALFDEDRRQHMLNILFTLNREVEHIGQE